MSDCGVWQPWMGCDCDVEMPVSEQNWLSLLFYVAKEYQNAKDVHNFPVSFWLCTKLEPQWCGKLRLESKGETTFNFKNIHCYKEIKDALKFWDLFKLDSFQLLNNDMDLTLITSMVGRSTSNTKNKIQYMTFSSKIFPGNTRILRKMPQFPLTLLKFDRSTSHLFQCLDIKY